MKKLFRTTIVFALFGILSSCTSQTQTEQFPKVLPVEEYAQTLESDTTAYLLDVRTPEEYNEGHIEGARLLNVMDEDAFLAGIDSLTTEHTYYIYCRSGRRSQKASGLMTERGLKVIDLQGGYNAWKENYKLQ